jgi:MoCo/4Fe-4S cofactor protein with predicted Tat translocation signal
MKDTNKVYWKGVEQLTNDPAYLKHAEREFPEVLPEDENQMGASRRDFLKMMGFGIAAASLAACEAPVRKAIPYLNKPVDVDPGIPNYYASTFTQGGDYCSIVVKTREGRPIKIEGNKLSKISQGGLSAQVEASVLSLYDNERLRGPRKAGEEISWADLDKEVSAQLKAVSEKGGQIRIVSNTLLSPSTHAALAAFVEALPGAAHITYDTVSSYGMRKANEQSFGKAAIPTYDFSKAKVIVSFGADFLGTWINPVAFTKQYSKNRKINAEQREMSRHYQFESNLSLTGANADYRTPIKASQEGLAVAALYNAVAKATGNQSVNATIDIKSIDKAAKDLLANRGTSLVVSGSNDPAVQVMVNAINVMLNNYGTTLDLANHANYRQGDDQAMEQFIKEAEGGKIGAVLFMNANPVYNHPAGARLATALSKVRLKVSTSDRMDETSSLADYVAPDNHFLESWNDAEPQKGHLSLTQPAITRIFNTRQAQESFLTWAGTEETDYFTFLQNYWRKNVYPSYTGMGGFQYFWDKALHDGVLEMETGEVAPAFDSGTISSAASAISKNYKAANEGTELVIYSMVAIGDGTQANNPWLQEMPDPIAKTTWDNYVTISQAMANDLGITMVEGKAKMVKLTVGNTSVEAPVVIQPGQARGTIGLALGYGRTQAGKVANGRGVDAFQFLTTKNGFVNYALTEGVSLEVLNTTYQVAQTQIHETYMGRTFVIQESVLEEYKKNPLAGRVQTKIATWKSDDHAVAPSTLSLWKGHDYNNHHWGLAVDLNSCTGCGACTIACQAENNIPVVGRDEVIKRREMHWMRIDRYYSSDATTDKTDENFSYKALELASENPEVTFQPMMCQHCNNAPCETVCPVAATTHSTEGLNQMTYNRCIGTRYCANNCPYKVRRFNWFKYHDNKQFGENTSMNNDLGKMVLNPDVTVRSRGVMEKCSFCVQRIQYGKLQAKKDGRRPNDEEVNTACASSCPADALVFGDMNDPNSKISKYLKIKDEKGAFGFDKIVGEERAYHVLDELGVKPNVMYLTKIRNKDKEDANA